MKTFIRKIGNSAVVMIPTSILKSLELEVGDKVDIRLQGDAVIVKKLKKKTRYSLDELLKQCDLNSPEPKDTDLWGDFETIGNEIR